MGNLPNQIQELERIFDMIHNQCAETFGENAPITNLALAGSCRSFALYCDFIAMNDQLKDD